MADIDAQLLFSDAQALSGTSAVASTNKINLGADRNIGLGRPMVVNAIIDTSLAGSATETLTISLVTDDNEALGSTATVIGSGALTEAQAAAGQVIVIPIPPNAVTEQWLGLSYLMTGTTPTATVTAWLSAASAALTPITHYADNISIQ